MMPHYLEQLRTALAHKNPRWVKRPVLGTVVLVLSDEQGEVSRATIAVEPDAVQVLEGVHEQPEGLGALISGPLSAWAEFFHHGKLARMSELRLNGDVEILTTLAELLAQRISPLAVRSL